MLQSDISQLLCKSLLWSFYIWRKQPTVTEKYYLGPSPPAACSNRSVFLHGVVLAPGHWYGWYWLDPDHTLHLPDRAVLRKHNYLVPFQIVLGTMSNFPGEVKKNKDRERPLLHRPYCIAHPLSIVTQVKTPRLPAIKPIALTFRLNLIGRVISRAKSRRNSGAKLHYFQWEWGACRSAPFSWSTHQ